MIGRGNEDAEPAGEVIPRPTPARFALAANLQALMDRYHFVGVKPPQLEEALKKRFNYKLSAKQIRRILNAYDEEANPGLETIDALAAFFGVTTWALITPRERQPAVSGKERQTPAAPAHSVAASQHEKKARGRKPG